MKQSAVPCNRDRVSDQPPFMDRLLTSCRVYFLAFLAGAVSACAPTPSGILKEEPLVEQLDEVVRISEKDQLQQAYQNFAMAAISLTRGDPEKARTYLESAIQKDPDSVYLHQKMALLLKELREYPEALNYAQKAVDLDPSDAMSITLAGDLYALTGNDDLAVENYRKILDMEPENQRIRLLLTTILVRERQLQEALDHLDILIGQNPELVVAHYYRGRINLEMNRYGEAEKALGDALRLNESLEPALFDMATLYQMTDREEDAARTYEKLVQIYPDNIPARERLVVLYMKLGLKEKSEDQVKEIQKHSKPGAPERQALGLIYLRQGKLDDSIAELELIVKAWPGDDKSRYYLATAYEEKEDIKSALEHFREIPSASKYFVNAQIHIAHLLTIEEKFDEAIQVMENAISLGGPDRIELYLMLASVYEAKEAYDEAIAAIQKGLKSDDRNIDLIFRLGVLLDKKGAKDACIEQMQKILEINPNYAEALNYIGYTYAEQGMKLDEAKALIEKALEIKPDSGYIIDSLGWIYYKRGAYDKAIHHLEKAARLTPDDPTINEHLGDAYLKKENYEKALHYYMKALSLKSPQEKQLKEKITEVQELLKQKN
jgi:tetratricopeptide (TPR) repeat protein